MLFSVVQQCVLSRFNHILLFVTLWTVTCQAPQSMGILARILDWVAMPFSRDLPDTRMEPASPLSPTLVGGSFTSSATWEVLKVWYTGVGSHSFLQGIFSTQLPNPDLLHCRRIPYCLSHQVKFQNLPCLHRLMTSLQNFHLVITFNNNNNKNCYIDFMLEFWNRVMNKK